MDNSNKPNIRAYIGGTGSGKGVSIREYLKQRKPPRLAIWDTNSEYAYLCKVVRTIPALCAELQKKNFAVSFVPKHDPKIMPGQFDLFCRAMMAAGNLVMYVEELADVTKASWAPPAWRVCCKRGRHAGFEIIASTQSPADCDKAFFSGATYIRCFVLREVNHRRKMAACMDETLDTINSLQTVQKGTTTHITYLEKDFRQATRTLKTITIG